MYKALLYDDTGQVLISFVSFSVNSLFSLLNEKIKENTTELELKKKDISIAFVPFSYKEKEKILNDLKNELEKFEQKEMEQKKTETEEEAEKERKMEYESVPVKSIKHLKEILKEPYVLCGKCEERIKKEDRISVLEYGECPYCHESLDVCLIGKRKEKERPKQTKGIVRKQEPGKFSEKRRISYWISDSMLQSEYYKGILKNQF